MELNLLSPWSNELTSFGSNIHHPSILLSPHNNSSSPRLFIDCSTPVNSKTGWIAQPIEIKTPSPIIEPIPQNIPPAAIINSDSISSVVCNGRKGECKKNCKCLICHVGKKRKYSPLSKQEKKRIHLNQYRLLNKKPRSSSIIQPVIGEHQSFVINKDGLIVASKSEEAISPFKSVTLEHVQSKLELLFQANQDLYKEKEELMADIERHKKINMVLYEKNCTLVEANKVLIAEKEELSQFRNQVHLLFGRVEPTNR